MKHFKRQVRYKITMLMLEPFNKGSIEIRKTNQYQKLLITLFTHRVQYRIS